MGLKCDRRFPYPQGGRQREPMAEDLIRYDILAQDALRSVVRKVLAEVARTGLPGDHHFFISFVTAAPGVRVSERLLAQYEQEMTIVLQHQFHDLTVSDTGFEVSLSFDGHMEKLAIPFAAIKGFFDPSVQFGLQFDVKDAASPAMPETATGNDDQADGGAPAAGRNSGGNASGENASGDKIISLDSFRKKT